MAEATGVSSGPVPGSPPVRTAALERLRERTAEQHERLERRLGRFRWLRSRDAYASMLEQLYGFYAVAEPALAAAGAAAIDGLELDERRKAPLLAYDLAQLGRTPARLARLPLAPVPAIGDPGQALGALYVLEGATLGGKLIERAVARELGLARATGTAFFGAYGRDVAARWRSFGVVLEREAGERGDLDAIADAAAETFAALDDWLVA
jgi:heme oxygenase